MMNRFSQRLLSQLFLIFLSIICYGQTDSTSLNLLYKSLYNDSLIENTRVGNIKLYDSIGRITNIYGRIISHQEDSLMEDPLYELLNDELKPILILVKLPNEKTISGIGVNSPYFHTKEGELRKLFPKMETKHIGEYHEYAIVQNSELVISLKSDNSKLIGIYPLKKSIETTKDFGNDGEIESILIGK